MASGKYNGQAVAIKVYRSDIRNKATDGRFASINSNSSDSGTATLSTQGSVGKFSLYVFTLGSVCLHKEIINKINPGTGICIQIKSVCLQANLC